MNQARIHVLPTHIANQIAAGEVIQRPSNILKELVENALDAQATHIHIRVEKGGLQLVEVLDDGLGMNSIDARLCIERHATSKIQSVEDIFQIRTLGFRGEALASMAAVAQLTIKTKTKDDALGIHLHIDNSVLTHQEPIAMNTGTRMSVKNLFFNVPARKHFLKNEKKELDYLIEEFLRLAIPYPHISFELVSDGKTLYQLAATKPKQRILHLYKNYYKDEDLVSIEQRFEDLCIRGFISKPQVARRTRGHQYFFVNQRFIKNTYLAHAVSTCYQDLIHKEQFPAYFIFMEIDTRQIDINVHPTKQEIKFDDDKKMYLFMQATIKKSIATNALAPFIDFQQAAIEQQFSALHTPMQYHTKNSTQQSDLYKGFTHRHSAHLIAPQTPQPNWKAFFEPSVHHTQQADTDPLLSFPIDALQKQPWLSKTYVQLGKEYILTTIESAVIIIHQQIAHQAILYHQYVHTTESASLVSEPLLFELRFSVSKDDGTVLESLLGELARLGYVIEQNSGDEFVLRALPYGMDNKEAQADIERIIEAYKYMHTDCVYDKRTKLIRSLALKNSLKVGKTLFQEEMAKLVHDLFQIENPFISFGGMRTFVLLETNTIQNLFS